MSKENEYLIRKGDAKLVTGIALGYTLLHDQLHLPGGINGTFGATMASVLIAAGVRTYRLNKEIQADLPASLSREEPEQPYSAAEDIEAATA